MMMLLWVCALVAVTYGCSCPILNLHDDYYEVSFVARVRMMKLLEHDEEMQTMYFSAEVEKAFKSKTCLEPKTTIVVQTGSNSALCGYDFPLKEGTQVVSNPKKYILFGSQYSDARYQDKVSVSTTSCGHTKKWTDLSAKDRGFLARQYGCCTKTDSEGEETEVCTCNNGKKADACAGAPCEGTTCDVKGATCKLERCKGSCKAVWYAKTMGEEFEFSMATEQTCKPCKHRKNMYYSGQSFDKKCNTCTCDDGEIACTELECESCRRLKRRNNRDVVAKKPKQCMVVDFQCQEPKVPYSDYCGCGCEDPQE
eukprot:m.266867 g.266867  ORF g.266867 m.266867 type:complete len:311 (-) comp31647_c0_seq1:230-1162(-)